MLARKRDRDDADQCGNSGDRQQQTVLQLTGAFVRGTVAQAIATRITVATPGNMFSS